MKKQNIFFSLLVSIIFIIAGGIIGIVTYSLIGLGSGKKSDNAKKTEIVQKEEKK